MGLRKGYAAILLGADLHLRVTANVPGKPKGHGSSQGREEGPKYTISTYSPTATLNSCVALVYLALM